MNKLIHETSPYLLQHAHNPVDWYPWGEEALARAQKENKPILVSIGYAACHWCHVMERESFENEETARLMNSHFINIKIDREERPDLDHIYMDAVQAMTGSGGWPLNVFLTPDRKPFYGGTYFPPKRAYNRASWQETLLGVEQAFRERRHEIDAQAENLVAHLEQSNQFGLRKEEDPRLFSRERTAEACRNMLQTADTTWGGFGRAPKFPSSFSIGFLLRYRHCTGNEEALKQALLSLDKMIEGGIYDQLGGGFARYSTDTEWLVPHFEKMLYDNALLVSVLSEAYQLTGEERYREVLEETIGFVQRELRDPDGGFYAALDADSEGVEGKYYVWQLEEVQRLLGAKAALFCAYYDISEKGNWEGTNILRVRKPLEEFAKERGLLPATLWQELIEGKKILLAYRQQRVRPLLDDKIILGWNALMNTACCKAFAATGEEAYRDLALDNMRFLLSRFRTGTSLTLHHTWKNGEAKYPAFLDDYAYLAEALRHLSEITADKAFLQTAKAVTEVVLADFAEEAGSGFFYYTAAGQADVIVRKKEVYDGAQPSGNSVMAGNLYHLGLLFDKPEWRDQAAQMLQGLGKAILKYPVSFGNWATVLLEMTEGTHEIALTGPDFRAVLPELLKKYIPHRVLMAAETADSAFPLLVEKRTSDRVALWYCRNYTCQRPVFSVNDLMSLINKAPKPQ